MSNYANTKATIAANVYENHLNQVTANMAKAAINSVVDTLIAGGFLYKGVATTSTNPGSPDANVFYIATAPGTYTNFGSLVVNDGEVAILKYNGSWTKEVTGAATAAEVSALGHEVDGKTSTIKGDIRAGEIDENVWYYMRPLRIYFKKVVFSTPTKIDHLVFHSQNHPAGQYFNVAIYDENFAEVTHLTGKSPSGAVTRFWVETGDRGFLGDDTEVSIPQLELCGTYYIAFKTGTNTSRMRVALSDFAFSNNAGYLTKYSATIAAVSKCPYEIAFESKEKEAQYLSRPVSFTTSNVRVCGQDSNGVLYGHNTSTGKISKSSDHGASWTDFVSIPSGKAPSYIVVDLTNSCAYYQWGASVLKITALDNTATIEDVTPSGRHPYAATIATGSLAIAFGYLWYGEYTYATAGDGYTAENPSMVNNPYLWRRDLTTGVWHKSATFAAARHIHSIIPDVADGALWVIVGDAGIGNDVGVHRILAADITPNSDNADGATRWTSAYVPNYVSKVDTQGQDWYNVNAVVTTINGVKCLVGGSDRPMALCVVTKLADQTAGAAISFPQCFSYDGQPSSETVWNSLLDQRGNLYGLTFETTTTKLVVMPYPYNSAYIIYDFGELLQPHAAFYDATENCIFTFDKKILLPYFNSTNTPTITDKTDLFPNATDYSAITPDESDLFKTPKDATITIKSGAAKVQDRGLKGVTINGSLFNVAVAKFIVTELDTALASGGVYLRLVAYDTGGNQLQEKYVTLPNILDGENMLALDLSGITASIYLVAQIRFGSAASNTKITATITEFAAFAHYVQVYNTPV